MKLSWDINEDGDKVNIFEARALVMQISISELMGEVTSVRAKRFFRKSLPTQTKVNDMSSSKNNKTQLTINGVEARVFAEWYSEHAESCPYIKEHGEVFTEIHFKTHSEGGIGRTTIVECACGATHDITDVNSW